MPGVRPRAFVLLLAVLVLLRVIALGADPPTWLDWNQGIWTDEGFYTYHARNAVLFGRGTLDEWDNRTLMPVLDAVQQAVFAHWGVGHVPARMIAVVASLIALGFFTDALRRWFGPRAAWYGLTLLGGEVTFIGYNRLALMETPGLVPVCAALWALSLGTPVGWILAGALAASVLAFKTTLLVFLPIPVLVWLWERQKRPAAFYALGAFVGIAAYEALWGWPHHAAIWRMNHFYWTHQSRPDSLGQEFRLLTNAFGAYRKGILQHLEVHTPVMTTLAVLGLIAAPWRGRGRGLFGRRVFWLWLTLGFLALAATKYAPTRYYLIFYPALAGLAAVTLARLPALWRLARRRPGLWMAPALLLAYHAALPALAWASPRWYALPGALLMAALAWGGRRLRLPPMPAWAAKAALAAFGAISLGQWLAAYGRPRFEVRAAGRRLAEIVGPGQVVIGDWPANLCLDTGRRGAVVLPDQANWRDPVGSLRADYVLRPDTQFPTRYWAKAAPAVVRPENFVGRFVIHGHSLSLFRVPGRGTH